MGGILNKEEKAYLKNAIKPYRDRVVGIIKYDGDNHEYIGITFRGIDGDMGYLYSPVFEKGSIYKDMELDKEYSLKDLEL